MVIVTDPIGDFINRLKNAAAVSHPEVVLPYSQLKEAVAVVLKNEGYLTSVEKTTDGKLPVLKVALAYDAKGTPRLRGAKRISKPGRRLYKPSRELFSVKYGTGSLVLSTPKGIMTEKTARKENVGGETLFEIW